MIISIKDDCPVECFFCNAKMTNKEFNDHFCKENKKANDEFDLDAAMKLAKKALNK